MPFARNLCTTIIAILILTIYLQVATSAETLSKSKQGKSPENTSLSSADKKPHVNFTPKSIKLSHYIQINKKGQSTSKQSRLIISLYSHFQSPNPVLAYRFLDIKIKTKSNHSLKPKISILTQESRRSSPGPEFSNWYTHVPSKKHGDFVLYLNVKSPEKIKVPVDIKGHIELTQSAGQLRQAVLEQLT